MEDEPDDQMSDGDDLLEDLLENHDGGNVSEDDNQEGGEIETEAQAEGTVEEGTRVKQPAKKRVVLNPRPKLNPERLCGKRGIPILPGLFEKVKFKGKGKEKEDLNRLMSTLEHWGHRLFPIMTFDTLLAAVEKLGAKKPVQVCLKKMRLDMPVLDEDFVVQREGDEGEQEMEHEHIIDAPDKSNDENAFDLLLRTRDPDEIEQIEISSAPSNINAASKGSGTIITDEMKERMETNRRLAIEKRRLRTLNKEKSAQAEKNNHLEHSNIDSTPTHIKENSNKSEDAQGTSSTGQIRKISATPAYFDISNPKTCSTETQELNSTENNFEKCTDGNYNEEPESITEDGCVEILKDFHLEKTTNTSNNLDMQSQKADRRPIAKQIDQETSVSELLDEDQLLQEMWGSSNI